MLLNAHDVSVLAAYYFPLPHVKLEGVFIPPEPTEYCQLDLFEWGKEWDKALGYAIYNSLKCDLVEFANKKASEKALRKAIPVWAKVRERIWERDKGVCQVCGLIMQRKDYECGHIIDRAVGGSDYPQNVVAMCLLCNGIKPLTPTIKEYIEWVLEWRGKLSFYIDM